MPTLISICKLSFSLRRAPRVWREVSCIFSRDLMCAVVNDEFKRNSIGAEFCRNSSLGFCSISSAFNSEFRGSEVDEEMKAIGEVDGEMKAIGEVDGSGELGNDGEECESFMKTRKYLEFLNEMVSASATSVVNIVCKWSEECKDIEYREVYMAAMELQNRRMYMKALKVMEWLGDTHRSEMAEEHYASHLHLICKVFGLERAESYMDLIPLRFQGERVYTTLLANCVSPLDLNKAETVFNKMRELQLPLSALSCNQMIILYKRLDVKKIVGVWALMKKENIKPNAETYYLLIDSRAEGKDFTGMEKLVNAMRSDGIEPDTTIYSMLAKYYNAGGFKDKVLDIMRKIETGEVKRGPRDRCALLSLYALLGSAKGVDIIWKECELDPKMDEYMAAIEAWGRLGRVEKAEDVFEKTFKKWKHLSSRLYSALLNVYVQHKLSDKGRELIKRMGDTGCWIGPLTWDALVRLFLATGDIEKAASILLKASQRNNMRPMFQSYMFIMEQYANLGDVHNTEKIFQQMRDSGYVGRLKPFELLIQAYMNAKSPAYGILERMKAENVCPNKVFTKKLAKANAFMFKERGMLRQF